ncbi:MAG: DUF6169 family protein [Spirosomataceae bacterium]
MLNQETYPYFKNNNSYHFLTEEHLTYEVYFIDGEIYLPGYSFSKYLKVFGFHLSPPTSINPVFDKRIELTIVNIISEFFRDNRNIIIFTCDQSDKRERYRNKLFDIWFKRHSNKLFVKIDRVYEENLYLSLITAINNPFIEEIKDSFDRIGNNLK